MKKHLCALFDLDGVIVDTARFHFQAWKQIASEMGYLLTHEDNEKLKGVSRVDSLKIIVSMAHSNLSQDTFENYLIEKNLHYLDLIQTVNSHDILPGVAMTLDHLKSNGIKIGLGSASKNARVILDKLEITPFFEVLIDGNQVSKSKPDPEVFLKGCNALGVTPESCVVFEDSAAGITAAKAANMTAVALGDPDSFIGADFNYPDFSFINQKELDKIF
jgi:beta-phosphoglucomutase